MSRTYRWRRLPRLAGHPEKYVDSSVRSYRRAREGVILNHVAHEVHDFKCTEPRHRHYGWAAPHLWCVPLDWQLRRDIEDVYGPNFRNAVGNWHPYVGYGCGKTSARKFYRRLYARRDRLKNRAILRDNRNWTDDFPDPFFESPTRVDWDVD